MMRRWRQVPSGRGSGRVGAAWRGTGAASPWMRAALGLRIFLRPLLETLSFASRSFSLCVTYKKECVSYLPSACWRQSKQGLIAVLVPQFEHLRGQK